MYSVKLVCGFFSEFLVHWVCTGLFESVELTLFTQRFVNVIRVYFLASIKNSILCQIYAYKHWIVILQSLLFIVVSVLHCFV